VLGRVKDSSSHDSILFAGFEEKARVFDKDLRAEARRKSNSLSLIGIYSRTLTKRVSRAR
jgi:hypothetical protein